MSPEPTRRRRRLHRNHITIPTRSLAILVLLMLELLTTTTTMTMIVPSHALAATVSVGAAAASSTTTSNAPVAILGATGNLGVQTVRVFMAHDIPVKCLVRPASLDKLPSDVTQSPLVEIVPGELLDPTSCSNQDDGIFSDDSITASTALVDCLKGCGAVVACFGATRRTKLRDLFSNSEDVDPIHAKQINYRSMIALTQACKSNNKSARDDGPKIEHVVRITGKGEDPTGIFSILLNGLGSYCKAWNYQGEVVVRQAFGTGDIGYTIIRPGILKKVEPPTNEQGTSPDDLVLADNGGNDLKVTPVTYNQIAALMVELVKLAKGKDQGGRRVTLAAMNTPPGSGTDDATASTPPSTTRLSLVDKIAALQDDSREFPKSLIAAHKNAVRTFFIKVSAVVSAVGIGFLAILWKFVIR